MNTNKYQMEQAIPNQNITLYVYLKYLFFIWISKKLSLLTSLRADIFSIGNKTRRLGIMYM